MKTSEFLSLLRRHAALPVRFALDGGYTVPPGYHLTEIKRISVESMDCGAQAHHWAETHFELWVPPGGAPAGRDDFMPARKFLAIVDRVEQTLPLEGGAEARIHFGSEAVPAALFRIDRVVAAAGGLFADLGREPTRCKALERQASAASSGACGCGGEGVAEGAACGCAGPRPAGATCCA